MSGHETESHGNAHGRKNSLYIFLGVIAFCLLSGLIYWLVTKNQESTDDAQVVGHIVHVSSRISGQVDKVLVENETEVKADQPLVELDKEFIEANLKVASAQYEEVQAILVQSEHDIKRAKASVEAARSGSLLAQKDLERDRALKEKGFLSQQQLDDQQTRFEQARANLQMALAQLASAESNAAAAKLKSAKALKDQAQLNFDYSVVRAPFAGLVTNRTVEVGKMASPGISLFSLVSLKDTWIEANFKEKQIEHMKSGSKAKIWVDAYPGRTFQGHVVSISGASGATFSLLPPDNSSGNFVKVVQRFPVRIYFDEPRPNLVFRPGMSVEVTVYKN